MALPAFAVATPSTLAPPASGAASTAAAAAAARRSVSSRGACRWAAAAAPRRRAVGMPPPLLPRQRGGGVAPLTMQKQQETEWNAVEVVENSSACEEHRYIVIKVGVTAEKGSLADSYRVPGQYVQIKAAGVADAKPGFFAISCAPNIQGYFEFLIKETEGSAWLTGVAPGDQVLMSPVGGKGFPMSRLEPFQFPAVPEEEAVKDILLFATGSGIAPIRAAIESQLNGLRAPSRRSIKLYYGARYPSRMAYMDRFPLWASDKVEVIPVMSRPTEAADEWTGRTGYIQQALMQDGVAAPRQTGVLMCGVGGMTKDVKAFLTEQGVPEDRILTNF